MEKIIDSNANSSSTKKSPPERPKALPNELKNVPVSPNSGTETVYEVARTPFESPATHVVSERVQTLASQIYTELQKIMSRFSEKEDNQAMSGLMPLIVDVLESLDLSLIENQQLQVELELCRDDNEQLVSALEKEKGLKKKVDQRLIELEFQSEEDKQALQVKVDSLENIVKMLELKAKNSSDHSSRLEEKESELKGEYNKVHTRYTDLLRSHCDLMERVKILIGSEDFSSTSGPASLSVSTALRNFLTRKVELDQTLATEEQKNNSSRSNSQAAKDRDRHREWIETELSLEDASIIEDVEEIPRDRDRDKEKEPQSMTPRKVVTPTNADALPSLVAAVNSDNFFGMEKEVENLISENNELLATKNALNIVKDDLIAKVDSLESDLTMARDENEQLTAVKNRLKARNSQLEEELKKLREDYEDVKTKLEKLKDEDEESLPLVQRKRFTRPEMARVLLERNQYKEKLIELQEAVRWTELIRASRAEGESKSAIWKFFSNLFTSPSTGGREPPSLVPQVAIRYCAPNSAVTPALDAMRRRRARAEQAADALLVDSDKKKDSPTKKSNSTDSQQ